MADRLLVEPAAKSYLIGFRCVSSTVIELPLSSPEPAESSSSIEYGPPLPPAIAGDEPVALVVAAALPPDPIAQPVESAAAAAESAAPPDDAPLRELVREETPVPPQE